MTESPESPIYTYCIGRLANKRYEAIVRDPTGKYVEITYKHVGKRGFQSSYDAAVAVKEWAKENGFVLVRTL